MCNLCNSSEHADTFHDSEIMQWLADDPPGGESNARIYYVHKRREKIGYKGFRQDVWWMMRHPVTLW